MVSGPRDISTHSGHWYKCQNGHVVSFAQRTPGTGRGGWKENNHTDLGTKNTIVDDHFSFVAIIDWEFAQTAPWQANPSPMPFPLLGSDTEDILRDPSHLAYNNVLRQDVSRRIYRQKFQEAERKLEGEAELLKGPSQTL
ncbi:hypothetical protein B0T26DRAFT_489421 [Lasiosphaeria miniovina]|uniref:Aminoglycoside phosphotransferase domain-containing protein n=1 Tax=Lasiosphaeria miniovina TaxID=1954250 RepID=A0AA40DH90_9PEZI|nr:uncharacterized protein B0T26DRAFT_489421 [Lasiosphaeria miniovina]KAK0703055.1 hypothetical protein B0T26DRAFT_489421 [Lasiosphaeria miniovina]